MEFKKILGLDLGVTSIGWSLIKEFEGRPSEIISMGVRIIPLDTDESDEFRKGNAITKNQQRTKKRTARKLYYRYVLRRRALTKELKKHEMFDESLFNLPQLKLWELRAKAVTEKISLQELGRILYHLNQKRGYKSSKQEDTQDKKNTEYVEQILNRYEKLKLEGKTIGQKFYEELSKNHYYRTKQQVYPREAYIEEFNTIMKKQQEYYPDVLTDEFISHLRDDIIYFQRKLKSQKGLVSICEFEGFYIKTKEDKEVFTGPKVAHRSNPIFQVCKIWETINNIKIENKRKEKYQISIDQKRKIFEYLDNNEKLTKKELFEILGLNEKDGWLGNKMINKGIQGNITKVKIIEALYNKDLIDKWTKFNLNIIGMGETTYSYDLKSGEVKNETIKEYITSEFTNEPLYQLWHTIYSIPDIDECKNALMKKFGFDEETAIRLAKIDFTKLSYGNKSVKAIRKILPYLMKGYDYSESAQFAGYNHSNSMTKSDIEAKKLIDKIPLLAKNSLRQPVVEKILNQMIHIVNEIIDDKRGWVTKEERNKGLFEIRVELARELKLNKEERKNFFENINKIEKENKKIEKELIDLGLRANRKNIIKYRLFRSVSNDDAKANGMCIYTGKLFSLSDALNGNEVDVDHIIPKSLLFDDSQSNKVLTFRWINQEKGDMTAYDYMASKGKQALDEYIERVNSLFEKGVITKAKRDKLLISGKDIPQDFIERNLRETQYVSKKAREILQQISKNVWVTSGSVTQYLRRLWGWNDILQNLQLKRIKEIIPNPLEEGITEIKEFETIDGQIHHKEVIKDWDKRDDHRHHAIDALVVACTKQGYIQRLNTLSAKTTREELYKKVSERKEEFRESLSLIDKYFILEKPFLTNQVEEKVEKIIVSYKQGKKVATYGKRFIIKDGKKIPVQKNVLVPRGPLSKETIYGKIKILEKNKPLKYIFNYPHLIFKDYIRALVEQRLKEYNNDVDKALDSLKKDPIYLKDNKTKLEYATCYKEEYVVKYPLEKITKKDLPYIVDSKIREILEDKLKQHNNNEKEAFKEVYFNEEKKILIKSVRIFTGLSNVEPIKSNENNYGFVKPGNNHHLAIYLDKNGEKQIHICTFWHAVERKKYGFPTVIEETNLVWEKIENNPNLYPQSFIKKLPEPNLKLIQKFEQNELFILGIKDFDLDFNDKLNVLTKHIYRVQKISSNGKGLDIYFRHIYETKVNDDDFTKKTLKYYRVPSLNALEDIRPIKIRVNHLGEITEINLK